MKRTYLIPLSVLAVLCIALGYAAPWRHAQAEASVSLTSSTHVAPNQLRYPPGSPQLAYLDIRSVSAQVPPVMDPIPARITFDEDHTVRVFSPLSGRTVQIVAQPGHTVQAGDVLAWIEAPDYDTAVADVRKAQADNEAKQAALVRAQRLYDAGAMAMRELESARLDGRTSQAEVARANARLHGLGSTGRDGRFALRAPIAGVIAERHLNPGQEVRPDATDPLFIITDPSHLDVVADVPESDVANLHAGQIVRVQADGGGLSDLRGTIVMVGVVLDPNTRRIPVRARLSAPPPEARPEMFVRMSPLSANSDQAVSIPNSAIVTSGLQSYVFVEREPGLLVKTPVSFVHRGREVSYLRDGVSAQGRVVTRGAILLDAELASGE